MFKIKQKGLTDMGSKQVLCKDVLEPHVKPMVFLFDVEKAVVESLKELRINSVEGSFGRRIRVNNEYNEQKFIKLNHDYPANLHEFDVVILNLTKSKSVNYDPKQHELNSTSGSTAHALLSSYPEKIFNHLPLSINIAQKDINELLEKNSVIIAFCNHEHTSEYKYVEITSRGYQVTSKETLSSLHFYHSIPSYRARSGKKVKLPERENTLSPLFGKHLDSTAFGTCFEHPRIWSKNNQLSDNFIPLLLNERDEIVSYAHFIKESIVFVFPDIENKATFISELFKIYLPELAPNIFPFHGEFKWLDEGDYPLPGEKELLQHRVEIEEKFNKDIRENEEMITALKTKYKFLSDLISETGGNLVSAVEEYLRWLDFESVINLDDTNPDVLEEDIQVDCKDRFLVIEIKGIGGTSTDKDCSQVSKIKYRRAEERGKFDVFGLYIVNHQRYMPPKSRTNPPFTNNQIKDAGHDKRGLLTTYELYKAYFLIEDSILQKSDVRKSLFQTGLISLEPKNMTSLGVPDEIFKDGHVAILNLNGITLAVGQTLIVRRQGDYSKVTIESIRVHDEDIDTCNAGEVGIRLDRKLKNNSELFVWNI
ncbi:hypothetical protein ACSZNJ_16445 [Aeromonas hydrophila]